MTKEKKKKKGESEAELFQKGSSRVKGDCQKFEKIESRKYQ